MDSINLFIIKIEQTKNALSLNGLKTIVSDLWAWCDDNVEANPIIFDNSNDIEDIVADCYDKEKNLNESEKQLISTKLNEIISALRSSVN